MPSHETKAHGPILPLDLIAITAYMVVGDIKPPTVELLSA
jgi:hypothetical protein